MNATMLNTGTPATLAQMIRRAFGPCAAKRAAPYADVSDRTVSDWVQIRAEPGAWKLLRMLRHPGFRAELLAYIAMLEQEEANTALRYQTGREQPALGSSRAALTPSGGDAASFGGDVVAGALEAHGPVSP